MFSIFIGMVWSLLDAIVFVCHAWMWISVLKRVIHILVLPAATSCLNRKQWRMVVPLLTDGVSIWWTCSVNCILNTAYTILKYAVFFTHTDTNFAPMLYQLFQLNLKTNTSSFENIWSFYSKFDDSLITYRRNILLAPDIWRKSHFITRFSHFVC